MLLFITKLIHGPVRQFWGAHFQLDQGWCDWRVDGAPLVSSAGEPQTRAVIIRMGLSLCPLYVGNRNSRTHQLAIFQVITYNTCGCMS